MDSLPSQRDHCKQYIRYMTLSAMTCLPSLTNFSGGAVYYEPSLTPLKPERQQHRTDDLESPLLLPQLTSQATSNLPSKDAAIDPALENTRKTRLHSHWLLIYTTVLMTIAACQRPALYPSFFSLLLASSGLIWLQRQQVSSMPVTKVSSHPLQVTLRETCQVHA